jgi:hemin uptake protein HemP
MAVAKSDQPSEPGDVEGQPVDRGAESMLVYESSELLKGRREVWIEHGNEMYRLRITAAGKLYLTK